MKKRISLLLALVLVLSMGTSVFAAPTQGGTTTPATPAQSKVELTGEATLFSVTVPMTLPLVMNPQRGVVTTPGNIVNNSYGPVEIVKEEITAVTGWTLVPFATDMTKENVGSNKLGFCLNGNETDSSGDSFIFFDKTTKVDSATFTGGSRIIPGVPALGDSQTYTIAYRAAVPARAEAFDAATIAHVVFTFAWDTSDPVTP